MKYEAKVEAPTTQPPAHECPEEFHCGEYPVVTDSDILEHMFKDQEPMHECPEEFHCGEFPALTDQDLEEYKASGLPMDPNPFVPERFKPILPKNNYPQRTLIDGTPYNGPILHGLPGEEPQLTEAEKQQVYEYQQRRYQEFLAEVAREEENRDTLQLPIVRQTVFQRILNLLK